MLEKENRWINRQTFNTLISGSIDGNADSATRLKTAKKIAGVAFDGTAHINLPGVNMAGNQSTTGNAGTATKLATARNINGVAFDGTKDIDTGVGLGLKLVAILQTSVHQLAETYFWAVDGSTLETKLYLNTRCRLIEPGKTKLLLLDHIATASRFKPLGKYSVTSSSSPDSFTTETTIRIHYPSHGVSTGSTKTFRLGGLIYREVGCSFDGHAYNADAVYYTYLLTLNDALSSRSAPVMTSSTGNYYPYNNAYGSRTLLSDHDAVLVNTDQVSYRKIFFNVVDNQQDEARSVDMVTIMVYDI